MTKPFDNRELLARIKVILRRNESKEESSEGTEVKSTRIIHEELTFDLESRRVLKNGVPVSLTAKEFKILETLLRRPDKILPGMSCCRSDGDMTSWETVAVWI